MAVSPIMRSGVNGIQTGLEGLKRTAQDIADLNLDDRAQATTAQATTDNALHHDKPTDKLADAAEAIVDLKVHKRQVEASAKVVETADAVLGLLLDVRA